MGYAQAEHLSTKDKQKEQEHFGTISMVSMYQMHSSGEVELLLGANVIEAGSSMR